MIFGIHLDTFQAILLGITVTAGFVLNAYVASDEANIVWYSSARRPLWEATSGLAGGIFGVIVGAALTLGTCICFPTGPFMTIGAFVLVFPLSLILWGVGFFLVWAARKSTQGFLRTYHHTPGSDA
jgi:hypothetical protein